MNTGERYQQLTEQLLTAVQDYIAGGGEEAFLEAYDVGRSAVAEHLNALEMVALQQEALVRILVQRIGDEEGAHLTQAAAKVFSESLAPFELTTRSSKEGNALLRHLNAELERQVEERTTKLAESETRFRNTFEHAPIGIALVASDGRWLDANRALCAMLGYTEQELLATTVQALTHPDDVATELTQVQRLLASEIASYQQEKRYLHKNGHFMQTLVAVSLVRDAQGRPAYLIAQIQDVTEQLRLREQLIERERLAAIGTTAAKLAHEIGNPLNSMAVAGQLLERRLKKTTADDALHASVSALTAEIRRLSQLLHEFRSLSRRQQFAFRPTNIRDLVHEVLTVELPLFTERGIMVKQMSDPDLPLLQIDRDKFKQVVLNLSKNAMEAMPKGGALTVRVQQTGTQVRLEVADTGTGVPDGVNIFEPFITTKKEGSGLGLPIARQFVAAHGGTLTYSSTPGEGTTFTVTLTLQLPTGQESEA